MAGVVKGRLDAGEAGIRSGHHPDHAAPRNSYNFPEFWTLIPSNQKRTPEGEVGPLPCHSCRP